MFDIGFWELAVIAVVALLVIGPERLPRVARIAGFWVGRARRTLASVKSEIDRELKADELKQILDKQARSNPLESILEEPSHDTASPAHGAQGAKTKESAQGTQQGTRDTDWRAP